MAKISVADAALNRGVSPARIRAMISAGQIDAEKIAGRWLVEASSIVGPRSRSGQPYSARVAWAFMRLSEGLGDSQLSPSENARLRTRWQNLRKEREPMQVLRSVLARRGRRMRLSAPEPDGLLEDPRVLRSGRSDSRSGMAVREFAEGYVSVRDLPKLERDHLLVPARGIENVILRAVPDDVLLPERAYPYTVVVDLAEGGSREQKQAMQLFERTRGITWS